MISVMPRILKDDPTAQEFVNELNIAEDYRSLQNGIITRNRFILMRFAGSFSVPS